jgi:tetratricopeptide (TPR) repeat protein
VSQETPRGDAGTGAAPAAGAGRTAFAIALATFVVFSPALNNGFVRYDDPNQITDNPRLAAGLGADGLRWAFTSFEFGNWHPLTWVGHLATAQLFGLNPAGFHLTSLLFHAAAAAVLFLFLARSTGLRAPSAFAAGLFALHPLRVESVAWAAELKDPLSGFFFLLALLAYRRYAARPGVRRYLAVALACACALMAKPTAVVLPAILLVLDWWPLGRFTRFAAGRAGATGRAARLVAEKLPLAALAGAAALLTFHAQNLAGAVRSYEHPLWARLGNAAVSLVSYLGKTLWPVKLSYFYPHPGEAIAAGAVAAAVLVLALVSVIAARTRRTQPYLAAGWLWYLFSVAPMSGVVQAGFQAMADRYTYLPLIGIAVAAAFWLADRSPNRTVSPPVRWGAAVALLCCWTALTPLQIAHWRDSRALFSRALALDPDNWNAHLKLGELSRSEGDLVAAIGHLRRSVELKPDDIYARTLLGLTLGEAGRTDDAIAELSTAVRMNQWWVDAYFYLGIALLRENRLDEAEAAFRRELTLNRRNPRSHPYLGFCYLQQGNLEGAARHAAAYLRQEPGSAKAQYLDGMVSEARGDRAAASAAYRRALAIDPALPGVRAALERASAGGSR